MEEKAYLRINDNICISLQTSQNFISSILSFSIFLAQFKKPLLSTFLVS